MYHYTISANRGEVKFSSEDDKRFMGYETVARASIEAYRAIVEKDLVRATVYISKDGEPLFVRTIHNDKYIL